MFSYIWTFLYRNIICWHEWKTKTHDPYSIICTKCGKWRDMSGRQ